MNSQNTASPGKTRESGIDLLKAIACFMIVCLHFPGTNIAIFRNIQVCLGRCGVPIFFIISGYFIGKKENPAQWLRKKSRSMLLYGAEGILLTIGFYTVFYTLRGTFQSIWNLLGKITPESLLDFAVWNHFPFSGYLWYFFAYAYAIFILSFFLRTRRESILIPLGMILLAFYFILGRYSILFFGEYLNGKYASSFLFAAIPHVLIGYFISRFQKKFLSSRILCTIFILSLLGLALEVYLLRAKTFNGDNNYLFNDVLAIVLLQFAIKRNTPAVSGRCIQTAVQCLAAVGKNYSLYIYLLQYISERLCRAFFLESGYSEFLASFYRNLRPVIIFLLSMVIAALYIRLKQAVQKK